MNRILQSYKSRLKSCRSRSQLSHFFDSAVYDPALSVTALGKLLAYVAAYLLDGGISDDFANKGGLSHD